MVDMENNLFKDMPVAPILPEFPKYFPDLQGEKKDVHHMQDGTKMTFCHGFTIKIQRNLLPTGLECSFLQVN